ncbi:hypothetical protein [Geoglobus sp.]
MDTKAAIAFVVSLAIVSPLIYTIFDVGSMGGKYINDNNFRKLLPEVSDEYTTALGISTQIGYLAKLVLTLAAVVVAVLTSVEYLKFYKIYKEH